MSPTEPDGKRGRVPDHIRKILSHDDAPVGNQRLTALAGAILLVLFGVVLLTLIDLHTMLPSHVFIGVLLTGPLAVKLGSTGYRFAAYYTRSPSFVLRGRPHAKLRILAPLLIVSSLTLIGSGIGLVVAGPAQKEPFLVLHIVSALIWLRVVSMHVFAHVRQVPGLILADWRSAAGAGRTRRVAATFGALAAGGIAAWLVLPLASPWVSYAGSGTDQLGVAVMLSALARDRQTSSVGVIGGNCGNGDCPFGLWCWRPFFCFISYGNRFPRSR